MVDSELFDKFGQDYAAGTVLFREGDSGGRMYVVQSGEVEISRRVGDREVVMATIPAGEFFGEMSIINGRPRSATAIVKRDARLLVVDGETFEAMLRNRAEIGVRLIKTLAQRLDQTNRQLELLLLEDANHRVVQCLRNLAEEQAGDDGGANVIIAVSADQLAARVALGPAQVREILAGLEQARLIVDARSAGHDEEGYLVPEVGRLLEFLEFLEIKERYSQPR